VLVLLATELACVGKTAQEIVYFGEAALIRRWPVEHVGKPLSEGRDKSTVLKVLRNMHTPFEKPPQGNPG